MFRRPEPTKVRAAMETTPWKCFTANVKAGGKSSKLKL